MFSIFTGCMYKRLRTFLEQFVSFSDAEFGQMKEKLAVKELKKKEFLTLAGETERYIYFVTEGIIHQFFYKGKQVITIDLIPEGTMANAAVSFFSGKPSHYYLQALEPTRLLALSRDDLEELYQSDKKWQRLGRILITYFLIRQEKNNIDGIRLSIPEKFLQFAKEYPDLMKRVPQRTLASYLNIKPETFTRLKPLLKGGPVKHV
jgi:CRP-like cAMP-binding protein